MDMGIRKCTQKDHQNENVQYLCIHTGCDQENRTLCYICLIDQMQHKHEIKESNHFMRIDKFNEYNKIRLQQLVSSQLKQFNLIINKGRRLIQNLQQLFDICEKKSSDIKKQYKAISDQLQQEQINYGECIKEIDKFYQTQQEELNHINNDSQILIDNIVTDINLIKRVLEQKQLSKDYQAQIIPSNNCKIKCSQISNNERYLVTCFINDDNKSSNIQIRDIILNFELQNMKYKDEITCCDFSPSSQKLFLADKCGHIYTLQIKLSRFDQISERKHICEIVSLKSFDENKVIITDQNKDLLIVNTTIKNQSYQDNNVVVDMMKERIHEDLVRSFDFNKKKKPYIATCSHDLSIKIWQIDEGQIKQLIHQNKCHKEKMEQIQFNQDASNIITLDFLANFKHWSVDYKKKEIIQLHQIQNLPIYNCSFVGQDQIQLIGKDRIYWLNPQYGFEQEFLYEEGEKIEGLYVFPTKQAQSRKYIIIPKLTHIKVLGPSYLR